MNTDTGTDVLPLFQQAIENGNKNHIEYMMTKEELLKRLTEIEWDAFECKATQDKQSEDVWETEV